MADGDQRQRPALNQPRELAQWAWTERRNWVIGGVAALVVLAIIFQAATATDWNVVARGLVAEDEAAALAALDAKKIPYRQQGGGTILVPADKVHQARLELAVGSLPSGQTVGFELFDEAELGRTSFNERVNYHRALEGELSRTIKHLAAVEAARVHLVIPKRRLFDEDQAQPTASVVLRMRRGASLPPRNVQAIRHLVAGAVEQLSPSQVAVVDQAGKMLARPDDEDFSSQLALESRTQFERQLESRISGLLEPVVGAGKVRVQVAARLDFSREVKTNEKYDPESQVIRSERERTEKSDERNTRPEGPPGTATNLPDRQPNAARTATTNNSREKLDHIKNYEIDKEITRTESPHPRVERLSVGVVVDHAAPVDEGGDPVARSPEELASYKTLVANAVGVDTTRGDQLDVANIRFAPVEALPDAEDDAPKGLFEPPNLYFVLGGAALLLGLVIGFLVWRSRRKDEAEPEPAEDLDALEEIPPSVQEQIRVARADVLERAQADIRATASVLTSWLEPPAARPNQPSAPAPGGDS